MQETEQQKRPSFYYGWIILGICAFSETISLGVGGSSFGIFLRPMSDDLGWSRTAFTGAVTLQSLTTLMVAPVVGILLDRYGPRFIMAWGALVAAGGYLLLGRVTELWQFYVLYALAAALGLHELGNLVTTATITKWFIRMRGRALAVNSAGTHLGHIIFAPITAFLVSAIGWRMTWGVLGIVVLAATFPPAVLFMRRTPEDMGLRPDGDPPVQPASDENGQRARSAIEPRWDVRSALRTRTLWVLVIANNLASIAYGGVIYHLVPFYTDIGYSLQAASTIIALNHLTALSTKWPWGLIADRIPPRYGLMVTYGGRAAGLLFLALGTSPLRVFGYVLVSGSLSHSIAMFQTKMWADYYGRAFIGSIRGVLTPLNFISSIGGPLFAAFVFDSLGSYNGAFWTFIVALSLSIIVLYFAIPPGLAPNQVEAETSPEAPVTITGASSARPSH